MGEGLRIRMVQPYNSYVGGYGFHGYGNFIEADGDHNLCSYSFSTCNGYMATSAR